MPFGEFIKEEVVPIWQRFWKACLGDDIPHQLVADGKVILTSEFVPGWSAYVWEFVWNGMILEPGMHFEDLAQEHAMSTDEPVDVSVVYREWHSEYAPKNEGS